MNRKFFTAAATILAFAFIFIWLARNFNLVQPAFSFADCVYTHSELLLTDDDCPLPSKTVYLTFDDGPSDRITPKILDVLDEENVKATFFIIGMQAETRDYIIKREVESGHTVAVHSYTHEYSEIYKSPESLIKDIDKCNSVIKKITGKSSELYRFPGGSYGLDARLIDAVTEHGMRYVDWNASTGDAEWGMNTVDQLFKAAVTSSADCNNIVLLSHDSTKKTATPEATKRLIQYYKEKGYSFGIF